MSDIQKKLAEYSALVDEKKKELLKEQNEVHAFVDSEHKAKTTKKYQKNFRKTATEINTFVISLIEAKATLDDFKEEAEKLSAKGMDLNALVRDIHQELSDDFTQRQQSEAIDIVKITGVIAALAVAAVTISNKTFDPNSSHAAAEASAGATTGVFISFHKQLFKAVRSAANAICTAPQKAKRQLETNNFREYANKVGKLLLSTLTNERSSLLVFSLSTKKGIGKASNLPQLKA